MRGHRSHALAATVIVAIFLATLVPGPGATRAGIPHPGERTSHPGAAPPVAAAPTLPRPSTAPGTVSWAQYMGGPTHTAANPFERTISPSNVSNLTQVWSYATNGSLNSAPIVVNGTVYFGSWAAYEYAVRASNGSLEWKKYLNMTPDCSVGGIESTPAYSNGSLYLGAPNGTWVALNASNGSIEWSFLAGASANGYYDWASAMVFGHSLYIGTASCFDSPLIPGQVFQVNLTGNHTANHTWSPVPNGRVGSTIWTTCTADPLTNTVWVTTGNDPGTAQKYAEAMVALNATDLSVRGFWQVPNVVGFDSDFGSTATLVNPSNGPPLIVASNKNGVTYAFNRSNVSATGWSPIWSLSTGGGFSGAAFDGTTLYVGGLGGDVYGVYPSNGTVKWHTTVLGGAVYASLTVANGVLYVGGGSTEYALGTSNGKELWNVTPPGASIDGESVVVNGRLFVPVSDGTGGHLYAYGLPLAVAANATVPNATAAPATAQFTGSATGGMPPYSFAWSFDDGANATGVTLNHTFLIPGNHTTGLNVTDSAGVVRHTNVTVRTTAPPLVLRAFIGASRVLGEAPLTVAFNGTEVNGTRPPFSWSWDFGDGFTGAGAMIDHTFNAGGIFHVVLNLSQGGGGFALATTSVHALPHLTVGANASSASGVTPFTTRLSATYSGGRAPYDVAWTFGDGSSGASGVVVNHTYSAAGNFTANATVTDGFGVVVTASVVVSTTSPPPPVTHPALAANPFYVVAGQGCNPDTSHVRLTANASGGTAPYSDGWSFGDGSSHASGPVVDHNYTAVGATFAASLTVVDANGTTVTTPVTVQLPALPCPPPATTGAGSGLTVTEEVGLVVAVLVVLALAALLVWRGRRSP